MHDIHLSIVFIGILVGLVMASIYLWIRDSLNTNSIFNVVGFGLVLGLLASASLFNSWFIFIIIMSAYAAYFIYLKDYSAFSPASEGTMVSLVTGVVIGLFGLIGCVVCHA